MALLVLLQEKNNLFTYKEHSAMKALHITYIRPKSKCTDFSYKAHHCLIFDLSSIIGPQSPQVIWKPHRSIKCECADEVKSFGKFHSFFFLESFITFT